MNVLTNTRQIYFKQIILRNNYKYISEFLLNTDNFTIIEKSVIIMIEAKLFWK